MNLSDYFPEKFKKEFAERNIDLGSAILVHIPDFNLSYDKYAIYFAEDCSGNDTCGLIIINSPTEKSLNNKRIRESLVLINKDNHPFLEYDSFADCSRIREHKKSEIIQSIMEDPSRVLGPIHDEALKEISSKLLESKTISLKLKKRYSIIKFT